MHVRVVHKSTKIFPEYAATIGVSFFFDPFFATYFTTFSKISKVLFIHFCLFTCILLAIKVL